MRKIKVLIVDDSATARQMLKDIIEADSSIEVIGAAADPYFAVDRIKKDRPDVITLDMQMPRMDGLTFLKKIMEQHPIPVVVVSAYASDQSKVIEAKRYGAFSVISKLDITNGKEKLTYSNYLISNIKEAASHIPNRRSFSDLDSNPRNEKYSADVIIEKSMRYKSVPVTEKFIVIGSSTGGTQALREVFRNLDGESLGIVVVQHMPANYTQQFAESLNDISALYVKEAETGDVVTTGTAFIAPGGKHLMVKRVGINYQIEIVDGPHVNRHKPSVDVLFRSVARSAGQNVVAFILTGMGDDGAQGMLEIKESGGETYAQDQESSVVYGMPKVAKELGGVNHVVSINEVASLIRKLS